MENDINVIKTTESQCSYYDFFMYPVLCSPLNNLLNLSYCYPVRPRSRADQAPFLSLTCDISLIDNLCGKSHCVPKLAPRTLITIYGLERAGRRAAHATGWRKMHRRLRRHPQGAGTEWNRRRVGVGAADYVSRYFRLFGLVCFYLVTRSKNFVWSGGEYAVILHQLDHCYTEYVSSDLIAQLMQGYMSQVGWLCT